MEEGGTIFSGRTPMDYSKANCNPRHNNVNAHMSIETDVWQNGVIPCGIPPGPLLSSADWGPFQTFVAEDRFRVYLEATCSREQETPSLGEIVIFQSFCNALSTTKLNLSLCLVAEIYQNRWLEILVNHKTSFWSKSR